MVQELKLKMQKVWRKQRMAVFEEKMPLKNGSRIIDLGGLPPTWEHIDLDLDITLLNLPDSQARDMLAERTYKHKYTFVEGDACDAAMFADNSFDIVYSNSVIEHVGDESRQQAYANTVRRLAPSYWIQTPSIWFPIEAHSNMPFWWFYPEPLKQAWIKYWKSTPIPFMGRYMSETTVVTLPKLKTFFPEAKIYREYVSGFVKSYTMYHNALDIK